MCASWGVVHDRRIEAEFALITGRSITNVIPSVVCLVVCWYVCGAVWIIVGTVGFIVVVTGGDGPTLYFCGTPSEVDGLSTL